MEGCTASLAASSRFNIMAEIQETFGLTFNFMPSLQGFPVHRVLPGNHQRLLVALLITPILVVGQPVLDTISWAQQLECTHGCVHLIDF